MLIDTHAHLIDKAFNKDLDLVLERAVRAGVKTIINVGFTLAYARKAAALADIYPELYAAVGIHPHDAAEAPAGYLDELKRLAEQPKVVAVGEMGLDFYRNISPPKLQEKVFREQLCLAKEVNLPVVVHDREAHSRVMTILRQEKVGSKGGVLHCFSGDVKMALQCVEEGFYISIAGPVTFKNAATLRDVVRNCPRERLLLETDCPYLAPMPHRGKRNEPAYTEVICKEVARVRGEDFAEVAVYTTDNARRLFNIPPVG